MRADRSEGSHDHATLHTTSLPDPSRHRRRDLRLGSGRGLRIAEQPRRNLGSRDRLLVERPRDRDSRAARARRAAAPDPGRRRSCAACLRRAIEINPQFTQAYLSAGDIHRQRGDYAAADGTTARPPHRARNFDAQYSRALVQLLKRFGEAIRYLRALAIRPDDFNANLNIATAYLQVGEPEQGLPYAQRAVRQNPSSGEARVNLGSIYAGLGRHLDAVNEFQQASEMMSLNSSLLLNLANSLYQSGRFAEAANTLEEAVRVGPTAIVYERLGASRYRLGQAAEAEAAFRRALDTDPTHFPAMNGVAVCLLSRYVLSRETDEAARIEAMTMLRRSLRVPRQGA